MTHTADEILLQEIAEHCNNFHDGVYPPGLLRLADKIAAYIYQVEKDGRSNITSSAITGHSEGYDLERQAWQAAFARELSIYKRAKFI